MKFILLTCALIAAVAADVSHLSASYLPPHSAAGSVSDVAYAAPAASSVSFESAPAESFHTTSFHGDVGVPAASFESASYEAPVSFGGAVGAPGASSFEYAASAAAPAFHAAESFAAPAFHAAESIAAPAFHAAESFAAPAFHAAESFAAPAASFVSQSIEAAPAHSYSETDGYRYKTQRRVVYRNRQRRDVSHLTNDYLPPFHGSGSIGVPTQDYLPPQGFGGSSNFVDDYASSGGHGVEYGGGAVEYGGGGVDYGSAGIEPAHSYSADSGYRYRTNRRRVLRRHRN